MGKEFEVKTMSRPEVDIAVEWARQEGWNPGIYDADSFYAADPNGFFVGLLNSEPVATVSAVRYGDSYGFMGFYIVKKGFRGKGYGMEIFDRAREYLGNRNIGGDGVIENLEKYAKIGLKLAHYNARYKGFGTGLGKVGPGIVPLSDVPFDELGKYDDFTFGFSRREFLKLWVTQPESHALGYVEAGQLKGYGVIRKCFTGYKVAPIFAEDVLVAENLFNSLVGQVGQDSEVYFDVPEVNEGALEIVRKNKMEKVFATGRIYTKGQPNFPLNKWFGITSFELG